MNGRAVTTMLALVCCQALAAASADKLLQDQEEHASALFTKARRYELRGSPGQALEKLEIIVKNYPRTTFAGRSQWEIARLYDDNHEAESAFDACQLLIEHFPPYFEQALAMQYKQAKKTLARYDEMERLPGSGKPKDLPNKAKCSEMLKIIIHNAPYADSVADAQYLLGVAYEREGKPELARAQHELFADKFKTHPLADDAFYQIAYIDYKAWAKMKGDAPHARDKAQISLLYFLARYPESDKAAQAVAELREMREAHRRELLNMAHFYEARKQDKSAGVYYELLLKAFPEAAQTEGLMAKVEALRTQYPELKSVTAEPAPKPVVKYDPLADPIHPRPE